MIIIPHFTYEAVVTYADVAMDGKLSYPGMLRILQEAAARASAACGYGFKDIERNGVCWVLTGWRLELFERANWNDTLTIHTWPRSVDGFLSDRDFEIFAGNRVIGRCSSRWFLVKPDTGRITRVTEAVRSAYTINERRMFETDIPSNGTPAPGAVITYTHTVERRDLDTYRHVNNLRYLDFALEALPQEIFDARPSTVDIVYRKQILPGTEICCLYSLTEDGRHQIEVRSGDDTSPVHHAYIWFY